MYRISESADEELSSPKVNRRDATPKPRGDVFSIRTGPQRPPGSKDLLLLGKPPQPEGARSPASEKASIDSPSPEKISARPEQQDANKQRRPGGPGAPPQQRPGPPPPPGPPQKPRTDMPGKEKLNNVRQAAMDALKDSNQKPSAGADMPPPPMVVKFDPIANAAKGIDPYFNNSGQLEAKRNVQDTIHELIKSIDHAQRVQKLNDEMKNFTVGTISLVAEISDVVSNYASAWTDIQQDLKLLADKVSSTRSEDSIKTIRQLTRNEMSKLFDTFQDSLNKLTKVLPGDNNSLRGRLSQSQNDLRKIMDLADGYFRDMSGTPAPQAPPQKQNR